MYYGDFRAIADTAGFIIVHPEGKLDNNNNTHFNVGWGASSIDDLGFASALIDSLLLDYSINEDRVYSTGMSNGGFMSFHLACNLSNRIAAIASVTGSMVPQTMTNCAVGHATAIMQIHGTSDPTVNYNGTNFISEAVPNVLNYWSSYDNCDVSPITTNVPNTNTTDGCTAQRIEYLNGDNCTEVVHYKISGGGHTWPGAPVVIGTTNYDINASIEIWKFLSKYDINGKIGCNQTSGLYKEFNMEFLEVYPNPAIDELIIKGKLSDDLTYQLLNPLGLVVASGIINSSIRTIDVSALSSSVYYLKIADKTVKIIK